MLSEYRYSGEGRQEYDGYELPFSSITQPPEEFLGIRLLAVIDGQQEEELSPSTFVSRSSGLLQPETPAGACEWRSSGRGAGRGEGAAAARG